MWLLLLVMAVLLVLDRTKVLQCNTLFMSVMYLIGIPVVLCSYTALTLSAILKLLSGFSLLRCIGIGLCFMMALPVVILMLLTLFKICRTPIDKTRWNGKMSYDLACAKRQLTLLWVAYPLTWLAVAIAFGVGIYMAIILGLFSLAAFTPFFWVFTVCTFGLFAVIYAVFAIGAVSPFLVVFMMAGLSAVLFFAAALALMGTMLFRLRGRVSYTKGQSALKMLSMLIPVVSLITLINITRDIKRETGIQLKG